MWTSDVDGWSDPDCQERGREAGETYRERGGISQTCFDEMSGLLTERGDRRVETRGTGETGEGRRENKEDYTENISKAKQGAMGQDGGRASCARAGPRASSASLRAAAGERKKETETVHG